MEQLFISRHDAARVLNISTDTLDRLADAGHIAKIKIGARTCYAREEIERFSRELMKKGAIKLA